jgi:regulation of enolase protein 1 (concanavalin A-like superfamily)
MNASTGELAKNLVAASRALKAPRQQSIVGKLTDSQVARFHDSSAHLSVNLEDSATNLDNFLPDDERAKEATVNIHKILVSVEGESSKQADSYETVRARYLEAVKKLSPQSLPEIKGDAKKQAIEREKIKKQTYAHLKEAWDVFEVVIEGYQHKLTEATLRVKAELAMVEDRVDKAWVQYAKKIVERAATDGDMDEREVAQWEGDRELMMKESETRRKHKLKQQQIEEEKYWKQEAELLRTELMDQSELGSESEVGGSDHMEDGSEQTSPLTEMTVAAVKSPGGAKGSPTMSRRTSASIAEKALIFSSPKAPATPRNGKPSQTSKPPRSPVNNKTSSSKLSTSIFATSKTTLTKSKIVTMKNESAPVNNKLEEEPKSKKMADRKKKEAQNVSEGLASTIAEIDGITTALGDNVSARICYLQAIYKVTPTVIDTNLKGAAKKNNLLAQSRKKEQFDRLLDAMDMYQSIVERQSVNVDAEKQAEKQAEKAEDLVIRAWAGFAKHVVKEAEQEGDQGDEEYEDEILKWRDIAARLKAQALGRKRRRKRKVTKAAAAAAAAAAAGLPDREDFCDAQVYAHVSRSNAIRQALNGDEALTQADTIYKTISDSRPGVHYPWDDLSDASEEEPIYAKEKIPRPELVAGTSFEDSESESGLFEATRGVRVGQRNPWNDISDNEDKTPTEIAAKEEKTRTKLSRMISEIVGSSKKVNDFVTARNLYLQAVQNLVPLKIPTGLKSSAAKTTFLRQQATRKAEFVAIKNAFDKFELAASDKSKDDKTEEATVLKIEDTIDQAWCGFSKVYITQAEHDDADSDEEYNGELEKLKQDAMMLKARALARKRRKRRKVTKTETAVATAAAAGYNDGEDEEDKKVYYAVATSPSDELDVSKILDSVETEQAGGEPSESSEEPVYHQWFDSSKREEGDGDELVVLKSSIPKSSVAPSTSCPVQDSDSNSNSDYKRKKEPSKAVTKTDAKPKELHMNIKALVLDDATDMIHGEVEPIGACTASEPAHVSSDESESEDESEDASDSESEHSKSESEAETQDKQKKKKKKHDLSKKKKKKKKKKAMEKKKKRKKDKKHKKRAPDEHGLKEDALGEARNMDGTVWKNPLRFWSGKPPTFDIVGASINMKIPANTDYWRKTRSGDVADSGPLYWHKISGNFELIVKITSNMSGDMDKAGLMIRLDESNWIMTGMESFGGRIYSSSLATCDFTDWSRCMLPVGAEKQGIWFCFKRYQSSYECFYSYDALAWYQTRQGMFTDRSVLSVGIAGACPSGDSFKAAFEYYRVKSV